MKASADGSWEAFGFSGGQRGKKNARRKAGVFRFREVLVLMGNANLLQTTSLLHHVDSSVFKLGRKDFRNVSPGRNLDMPEGAPLQVENGIVCGRDVQMDAI